MSTPSTLRIKRKAADPAPSILILEQGQGAKKSRTDIRYELRTRKDLKEARHVESAVRGGALFFHAQRKESNEGTEDGRRVYQLSAKRAIGGEGRVSAQPGEQKRIKSSLLDQELSVEPLKRPNRRVAVKPLSDGPIGKETVEDREKMQELADYLQDTMLGDECREPKQPPVSLNKPSAKSVAAPKLSGQRSRAIHQQRIVTNDAVNGRSQAESDAESDMVYDEYVLANASDAEEMSSAIGTNASSVGYLVIAPEDQELRDLFLGEDVSEDETGEDNDSNAEDYYGADYPEDELASDDEFDAGAYGFRGHGASDEEAWDEDTGAYSDEDEYEKATNSLRL